MTAEPLSLTTLVLVGGHSRRMGTDKALLLHPRSGSPLLLPQLLNDGLHPRVLLHKRVVHRQLPPDEVLPPEPPVPDDRTAANAVRIDGIQRPHHVARVHHVVVHMALWQRVHAIMIIGEIRVYPLWRAAFA